MKENLWSWVRGIVDRNEDHIEIRYGSIKDSGYDEWIPAALISAPKEHRFLVEFLMPEDDPKNKEIMRAIKGELDFYLVKKGEMDPWAYACYHCGTSANAYSDVHWSFFPKGWERKH